MNKKEDSHYDELENLVSILMEEVTSLKEQNKLIIEAVTHFEKSTLQPRKMEYVLKSEGLQDQLRQTKFSVDCLQGKIEDSNRFLRHLATPLWVWKMAFVTAVAFLLNAFILYLIVNNYLVYEEYYDFVMSSEKLYDYFVRWREAQ